MENFVGVKTHTTATCQVPSVGWQKNMLIRVRKDALTLRDVKNETTSGDVHENKGEIDKMSSKKHAFYMKIH
jgi:hypothetical protein